MRRASFFLLILFLVTIEKSFASIATSEVGTLGGDESDALDINAYGTVVGWSELANGNVRAFSWTKTGGIKSLPILDGGKISVAFHVTDNGSIIGVSDDSAGEFHLVNWRRGFVNDSNIKITDCINKMLYTYRYDIHSYKDVARIVAYWAFYSCTCSPDKLWNLPHVFFRIKATSKYNFVRAGKDEFV